MASGAGSQGASLRAPITREHLDQIRERIRALPNRTPDDHEIRLEFECRQVPDSQLQVQVAHLIFKSGSRNALSGRMLGQLTERLDELERWLEEPPAGRKCAPHDQPEDEARRQRWRRPSCNELQLEAEAEAEVKVEDESHYADSEDRDARLVIVRGHGGTFCSGSDLRGVRETLTVAQGWELAQLMQYNLARLEQLPCVSVAFIQGYALGGGAELALGADLRIMTGSAKLGFVHARNGICCGWGGGARLIELVGRTRALQILASGRPIGCERALELGLCSAQADSLDRALDWALGHAIESRRVARALKRLASESPRLPFEQALQLEAQLFAHTWGKEAHLRALNDNLKHK